MAASRRHTTRRPSKPGRSRRYPGLRLLITMCVVCPVMAVAVLLALADGVGSYGGRMVEGKPLGEWVSLLGSDDAHLRKEADRIVEMVGPEATPYLAKALRASNLDTRRQAASKLKERPNEAKTVVSPLGRALYDRDSWVRLRAAEALRRIGPDARDAVLPLSRALSDNDPRIRIVAAQTLGKIGSGAILAHPALMRAMEDDHVCVRRAAGSAVTKIIPHLKRK